MGRGVNIGFPPPTGGLGTFAYVGIIPAAIMTHRNFAKGLKERGKAVFAPSTQDCTGLM